MPEHVQAVSSGTLEIGGKTVAIAVSQSTLNRRLYFVTATYGDVSETRSFGPIGPDDLSPKITDYTAEQAQAELDRLKQSLAEHVVFVENTNAFRLQ